jgi:hypothetical protein
MADNGANGNLGIIRVPRERSRAPRPSGRGWMVFAALLLLAGAALNFVYGTSAVYTDDYLAEQELLYGPVSLWGWLSVGIAGVMLIAALMLFAGSPYGAMLGMLIAGLNAVIHLMLIGGYTLWSVIVIAVDCLVIYGLATHGFGRARHAVHP